MSRFFDQSTCLVHSGLEVEPHRLVLRDSYFDYVRHGKRNPMGSHDIWFPFL
jgi:hypothetical protein